MDIIGIDTGGTFTDLAVQDGEGAIRIAKIPSTPADPAIAVERILEGMEGSGGAGARIVHGTTVATNALLEGKGGRVAIVNTRGFRDLLEIGRTRRAGPGLFNTKFIKPRPLVPRSWRFEVDERILADGTVRRPIDQESLETVAEALAALDPDVVVVCLMHAYRDASHERTVGEFIGRRLDRARVVLASDVVGEYREYERLCTAVINAFVLPKTQGYLARLGDYARAHGRSFYVMGSNGGIMTAEVAARFPARTILSGPAGGVNGGLLVCRQAGIDNFITCDMGGTSTDVSLVQGATPTMVAESMIAGLPLKLQQLDINTVGAGGGSIAWVDVDGGLRVGPQSAGASPGPACYARGGTQLTVTDADLLMGRLGDATLLGGRMQLDRAAARAALASLGERAGYADLDRLAEGVIKLAVARMVSAIREISVERGHDPRRFTLVPMGGAGPLHATAIAEELGIERILVPPYPGNLSAIGLTGADIRYDYAMTWLKDGGGDDGGSLHAGLGALADRGIAQLVADGFACGDIRIERFVDMRYRGQAFELSVPVEPRGDDNASLRDRFEALYVKRYGFKRAGKPVELVTLRVVATGVVPRPKLLRPAADAGRDDHSLSRRVYANGAWTEACPVARRERLEPGFALRGPAIVEEFGSTTFVAPGWRMSVDAGANLRLERSE